MLLGGQFKLFKDSFATYQIMKHTTTIIRAMMTITAITTPTIVPAKSKQNLAHNIKDIVLHYISLNEKATALNIFFFGGVELLISGISNHQYS